jgi:hypothetical protein
MFDDLNFEILNSSEYKEDAVREDIIMPILKKLGYSSSGKNKIKRAIPLTHPFVNIGSTQRKINIIPDYILETENGFKWILDAKGPNEDIIKSGNVEQAYSYAINPEVRCNIYALCNGRKLTAFNISKIEPILEIDIIDIEENWTKVETILSPLHIEKPFLKDFHPDFGLHLLKMGFDYNIPIHIIPAFVQNITKVNDELYTVYSVVYFGKDYGASFDFKPEKLSEFIDSVPEEKKEYILNSLKSNPYKADFNSIEETFAIAISAQRGRIAYVNSNETYIPLEVVKFSNIA